MRKTQERGKQPTAGVRGQIALWMLTKLRGRPGGRTPLARPTPRPPKKARGQIALWMLTKFAMVFFLIMLAAIMVSFSDAQKESICRSQAQSMARNIAATLTNVINSPVEDERKVFALESSLSVGKAQLERYTINITNIPSSDPDSPGTGSMVIHVNSGSGCEGFARAVYDKSIILTTPNTFLSRWQGGASLELKPSDLRKRDYYLIMAKCRPKQSGTVGYLYTGSCSQALGVAVDPATCPPFIGANATKPLSERLQDPVLQCCGWEALAIDPATGAPNAITGGKPKCV